MMHERTVMEYEAYLEVYDNINNGVRFSMPAPIISIHDTQCAEARGSRDFGGDLITLSIRPTNFVTGES